MHILFSNIRYSVNQFNSGVTEDSTRYLSRDEVRDLQLPETVLLRNALSIPEAYNSMALVVGQEVLDAEWEPVDPKFVNSVECDLSYNLK